MEPAGVSVERAGVSVELAGVSVEPAGVSVELAGVSVEPAGVSVELAEVSVEPSAKAGDPVSRPPSFLTTSITTARLGAKWAGRPTDDVLTDVT